MPDETKGKKEVKETPPAVPTDNKPADVKEPTEEPKGSLPEDTKERTKAEFEKLTKANQELKAKLDATTATKKQSVLDSLRPTAPAQRVAPPVPQPEVKQDDFVDAEGYVDIARLKGELQSARAVAQRATMTAQQNRAMAEREEMRRIHKEFPALDPESKDFDSDFFDLVRDRVISQMTKGQQDVSLAAKEVSKIYKSKTQVAKAKEEEKIQATTTAKEQINASGSSAPKRGTSQEDLVRGTMQGDRQAMYERMKNSGY